LLDGLPNTLIYCTIGFSCIKTIERNDLFAFLLLFLL
jgi:hypothetical protein